MAAEPAYGDVRPTGIDLLAERLASYLTPDQVNLVRRAYYYAEQAHDGQRRRSGEPYVTHPLAVANILADMHMDHQSLMAAMLHDVIEDTGIAKEALVGQFGETVAELVDGVSKLTQMKFETKAEAQAENFQKMTMAMSKDIRVILVKLADRLHNMRTLDAMPPDKSRRIAKETLEIYAPIANRLGMHDFYVEFEDLGFRAMHPMRAERIQRAVKTARGNRREILGKIQESLANCLAREGLGAVHNLYKPFPGRFKDYIAIPKANGYQSLHTTLFGMHGVPIEIQIRTREMEEMANNGIAAHGLYKAGGDEPRASHLRARQWVKGILELQQRAGNSLEFIENVKIDLFPDEVYVFTPKGRIMELPKGSTAVDFAYAVHTDVGNSCINRRLAPLSQPLGSGETVEIVTAPGARPNPAWLNFVVTGKARTNIRHALKQQRRSESISLGERLLNKALSGFGTQLSKISPMRILSVLGEYKGVVLEDLLEEIGLGNRMAYVVARRLVSGSEQEEPLEPQPGTTPQGPLAIRGSEGLVISYAKCCTPIPGDPIVGHLSAGKGMVIHLENCRNIAEFRHNSEKCIVLNWAKDVTGEFSVELRVQLEHQRGLIAMLANNVTAADANVEKIGMNERDGRISVVQLVVSVHDRVHLARVIKKLRTLKGVAGITRVRS